MSKRKGGTHLENALAKFQCVPARVSPPPPAVPSAPAKILR